ncbi:type II toxin-antitoxin system RelE/ParE family toxin [Yersinia alsatica]|uniref:type II toxin-antitoxin system RelE/ParE family toxin n=1 Tax=Yersinia alsatica TaxID=2890317 RepID=UPI0011A2D676|nr:type II toxin-antitoxin system RelE/ParE family toxin [Yersinia alsatica]
MGRDGQNYKRRKNFPIRLLGLARRELSNLDAINRAEFLAAIDDFERYGPASGIPKVEKVEGNMYELKAQSRSHWLRGFYFHYFDGLYVITHIFAKKTNKAPDSSKALGLRRYQDFLRAQLEK